jgi:hypothetical protein
VLHIREYHTSSQGLRMALSMAPDSMPLHKGANFQNSVVLVNSDDGLRPK